MADDLVYRVRCVSTGWGGAPGLNTFYFDRADAGPSDPVAAENVTARVRAFWFAEAAIFPNLWNMQVIPDVDVVNTDNGDLVSSQTAPTPAVVTGTYPNGFGPQEAMLCATYSTADIIDGRRVRGRTFIGPLAQQSDTDGTPLNGWIGGLQTNLAALIGAGLADPQLVVWSRRRGISVSHPTGLGGSAHGVTGVQIADKFAVLRSRRQ